MIVKFVLNPFYLLMLVYVIRINYFLTNLSFLLKLRLKSLSSLKLNLINHINSMINLSVSKFSIKIKRFRKIIKKANKDDITMMLSVIFQNKKIITYNMIFILSIIDSGLFYYFVVLFLLILTECISNLVQIINIFIIVLVFSFLIKFCFL